MKKFSGKNETVIPHDIASLILRHFCEKKDFLICFSDFERNFECGILNGTTVLCEGDCIYPVTVDFWNEVHQTESFNRIKIKPYHKKNTYAELVGMALNIKEISNYSVNVSLDSSLTLYVTDKYPAAGNGA
ncbi:MAG TPA: hypothetical protein DDY31_14650 [Lachnospiraceae bacterium]|nr:hypothetical protein [Lachnospiraceae bacterium]